MTVRSCFYQQNLVPSARAYTEQRSDLSQQWLLRKERARIISPDLLRRPGKEDRRIGNRGAETIRKTHLRGQLEPDNSGMRKTRAVDVTTTKKVQRRRMNIILITQMNTDITGIPPIGDISPLK